MAKRNATAALLLVLGLVGGLLLSGVLNAPAPGLNANEGLSLAAHAGATAMTATANGEKLAELREFAGKLETLFQAVAGEVSPAVVLIESQRIVRARGRAPIDPNDFFRGSPFGDSDRFFGPPQREQESRQRGLGSGFILDAEGRILTNNHVVQGAVELKVQLTDGREFEAEIVGTDPETDLAVIRIQGDPKDLPTVALGDSDEAKAGQWVLAVGNPLGLSHTVSAGIVSATGRRIGAANYESMIQTDAAINAGNSGGPLVNLKGEVIGVNAAILGRTNMGIGFAIPINMAKDILDDLIAGRKVVRGHMGVNISSVKPDMAEAFGYEGTGGALVQDVTPNSPAEKAGIQPGDIVTEFEGRPVKDADDLQQSVTAADPGQTVELKLWRERREETVKVKLGDLEDAVDWLGLAVRTLTEDMAKELGRPGLRGVVVTDVTENSAAAQQILPGDVILSVNTVKVQTAEQYRQLIRSVRPGQRVPLHVFSPRTGYAQFLLAGRRPAER